MKVCQITQQKNKISGFDYFILRLLSEKSVFHMNTVTLLNAHTVGLHVSSYILNLYSHWQI